MKQIPRSISLFIVFMWRTRIGQHKGKTGHQKQTCAPAEISQYLCDRHLCLIAQKHKQQGNIGHKEVGLPLLTLTACTANCFSWCGRSQHKLMQKISNIETEKVCFHIHYQTMDAEKRLLNAERDISTAGWPALRQLVSVLHVLRSCLAHQQTCIKKSSNEKLTDVTTLFSLSLPWREAGVECKTGGPQPPSDESRSPQSSF